MKFWTFLIAIFFAAISLQARETKEYTKHVRVNQTGNILHSKGNHYKMKRQPTEWETIFANNNWFICNIYKGLIKLNIKKPSSKPI